MSDVWEAYFRNNMYLVKPTADKIEACKKLLRGLQEDNDCIYTMPQYVSIREDPDDDWEGFTVESLE